jgi:AcrR family transcriptional regulator
MGGKGERTRAAILASTADLMNRGGFLGVPIADVLDASGLQKGGLYRHFASREALTLAAFDHAVGQIRARFLEAVKTQRGARAQLLALLSAYRPFKVDTPLVGGCPIMNAAIESDHASAVLCARARDAMDGWRSLVASILRKGQTEGEVAPEIDVNDTTSVIIGCLEGAVMLTQLYRSPSHLSAAVGHLERFILDDVCPATEKSNERRLP